MRHFFPLRIDSGFGRFLCRFGVAGRLISQARLCCPDGWNNDFCAFVRNVLCSAFSTGHKARCRQKDSLRRYLMCPQQNRNAVSAEVERIQTVRRSLVDPATSKPSPLKDGWTIHRTSEGRRDRLGVSRRQPSGRTILPQDDFQNTLLLSTNRSRYLNGWSPAFRLLRFLRFCKHITMIVENDRSL